MQQDLTAAHLQRLLDLDAARTPGKMAIRVDGPYGIIELPRPSHGYPQMLLVDAEAIAAAVNNLRPLVEEVQRLRNYSNDQHTEKVKFEARCRDLEAERDVLKQQLAASEQRRRELVEALRPLAEARIEPLVDIPGEDICGLDKADVYLARAELSKEGNNESENQAKAQTNLSLPQV